jgi:hypothetical protein
MSRLAIVGYRHFTDYEVFTRIVNNYMLEYEIETIISGGAEGVDTMAKEYANEYEYNYIEFPADWTKYGVQAGPIRNTQIVQNCDRVLAFASTNSRGTFDTIKKAKKILGDKMVKVIDID